MIELIPPAPCVAASSDGTLASVLLGLTISLLTLFSLFIWIKVRDAIERRRTTIEIAKRNAREAAWHDCNHDH